MDINELYKRWRKFAVDDEAVANELENIKHNEAEIHERFYRYLSFGTAGLRGILGAGTNRMNVYTVRLATQGFCQYLLKKYDQPSVAIAFDSRIKSDYFAKEAASVFAANEITVYMYEKLMPTPMLSYCIRRLNCKGGVNITASHNPAQYNGYKAYRCDGCQISEEEADAISSEINSIDAFDDVVTMDFEEALESELIRYIGEDISEEYYEKIVDSMIDKDAFKDSSLNIIYTPLCGAGNIPVRAVLKMAGFTSLTVVKEQEMPDGNFTSCPYPNPEFEEALLPGIKCAKENDAEMLLATDPDSDRLGVVLFNKGEKTQLTGNQVGILMTYYILEALKETNRLPENPIVIKSVVTSPIIEKITESYQGNVRVALT
ncbi:MAG: phospho-sugar mutase, partial [Oscillospiraceae bacterium]